MAHFCTEVLRKLSFPYNWVIFDPGTGSEVQYYVIEYRPKRATWDWKEISGAITQFYDIRGLTPYTEYEFVVLGVNNVGRGEKSAPIVVTTGDSDGDTTNPASKFLKRYLWFDSKVRTNLHSIHDIIVPNKWYKQFVA